MKIGKNTLSKAGVLLLSAVFILSSTAVLADTSQHQPYASENVEVFLGNMGTLPAMKKKSDITTPILYYMLLV